jgi:hypothetical protein
MIAVVDGQANQSYHNLLELLDTKISVLYPTYGKVFEQTLTSFNSLSLIPISKMSQRSRFLRSFSGSDMTWMELLCYRKIKIQMVPIITSSLAFENSVCGGQYPFASFLAARHAADYHTIMFIDGDTAMVEKSKTLQSVLYDRFLSKNSSKCAGHRFLYWFLTWVLVFPSSNT